MIRTLLSKLFPRRSVRCRPDALIVTMAFELALQEHGVGSLRYIRIAHVDPTDRPGFDEMLVFVADRLKQHGFGDVAHQVLAMRGEAF